jgi:two-component system, OmpR family, sensor kinase
MTHAGQHTGFWRSVRQLPDRTPLRTKLIAAVLALVVIALALISFVGISSLDEYLIGRADSELEALYDRSQPGSLGIDNQQNNGPAVGGTAGIELITADGTLPVGPYQSLSNGPKIPSDPSWLASNALKLVTVPAETGGGQWRVIVVPDQTLGTLGGGQVTGTLVYELDVSDIYSATGRLAIIDLLVSIAIVLLLAIVATAAVRASLRPLNEIEETAGAIAAGDLTQRVPERDPRTEVGRLGRSLNIMLGQIETAFRQRSESARQARRSEERMRQFIADASHELRTPLTAIRGFAEYYRQRGGVEAGGVSGSEPPAPAQPALPGERETEERGAADASVGYDSASNGNGHLTPADLDRIMRRVEQESARMGILVEDLLLLARMDQQRPIEHRPVDLLTLAADAVHDARVVAPNRSINLGVSSDTAPILVGDEVRLRQVIGNLMSNALTHTPDGTPIELRLRSGTLDRPSTKGEFTAVGAAPPNPAHVQAAILEVTDRGPGLTAEQAQHAFERFYRADEARSAGGTGLGLAIVAALVAAHGGTVWVDSEPGEGATFGIALPLAPEAADATEGADATDGADFDDKPDADFDDKPDADFDDADFDDNPDVVDFSDGPDDADGDSWLSRDADLSGWPRAAGEPWPTGPAWPTEWPPAP